MQVRGGLGRKGGSPRGADPLRGRELLEQLGDVPLALLRGPRPRQPGPHWGGRRRGPEGEACRRAGPCSARHGGSRVSRGSAVPAKRQAGRAGRASSTRGVLEIRNSRSYRV